MRFEELRVGMTAERTSTVTDAVIRQFAEVSGDDNPIHLDETAAKKSLFGTRIAHGMLGAAYISAVLGMDLPGPGTVYLNQTLRFTKPVKLDDTVTARVEILEIMPAERRVRLKTVCVNQAGKTVLDGEALIMLPPDTK